MTAKEMIELAKAGYKPSEIAEMHGILKTADTEQRGEPKVEPKEEPKVEPKEEPKVEPKEEPKVEPNKEKEDLQKLLEQTQKQLEEIQKKNINQNLAGTEPNEELILANLVKSFM